MNKLAPLALLLLLGLTEKSSAQNTAARKAEIKFTYSVISPNPANGSAWQRDMVAYILKTGEVFYQTPPMGEMPNPDIEKYKNVVDSAAFKTINKSIDEGLAKKKIIDEQVYTHFDPESRVKRSHLYFYDKKMFIDILDTLPSISWSLADSFKMIGTFNCQKATCRFRDQNYIAWFAADIPIQAGPHSLNGLPGLILEAMNTDKHEYYYFKELLMPVKEALSAFLFMKADETMSFADYRKGADRQTRLIKMQSEQKRIQ